MKKKLYLHIGPHKTGSTYIQKRFFDARKELLQHGYAYPDAFLEPLWGHHKLVELFQADSGQAVAEVKQAFSDNENSLIISSENFDRLNVEQITALKNAFADYDVRIIYVKRRADDLLVSSWQESVKHGGTQGWESYVLEHTLRPFSSEVINYCKVLDRYKDVFGEERIDIIDFDAVKASGQDLFVFFTHLVGLSEWNVAARKTQVNRSMPYWKAEIIRGLNALYMGEGVKPSAKIRTAFLELFSASEGKDSDIQKLQGIITQHCRKTSLLDSYTFNALAKAFEVRYNNRVVDASGGNTSVKANNYDLPNDAWLLEADAVNLLYSVKSRLDLNG